MQKFSSKIKQHGQRKHALAMLGQAAVPNLQPHKAPRTPCPLPSAPSLTPSPPPGIQNAPLHHCSTHPPTISTHVYYGAQATRKQRHEYHTTSDADQQQQENLMIENIRKV